MSKDRLPNDRQNVTDKKSYTFAKKFNYDSSECERVLCLSAIMYLFFKGINLGVDLQEHCIENKTIKKFYLEPGTVIRYSMLHGEFVIPPWASPFTVPVFNY